MAEPYFEQAADALRRAMDATNVGEQALLLEEAMRLNRLALTHEKKKLAATGSSAPGAADPPRPRPRSSRFPRSA